MATGQLGSMNLLAGDTDKKKQQNTQANLEKKRASLDGRHRYLLEKAAEYFDAKVADLEQSLLFGNKIDLLNDFFKDGGSRKVIFFYQPSKVCLNSTVFHSNAVVVHFCL